MMTETAGLSTPLAFSCPGCEVRYNLPLSAFASGRVTCTKCQSDVMIPDNARYRWVAQQIDRIRAESPHIVAGVMELGPELYMVCVLFNRVDVLRVGSQIVEKLSTGRYGGPGQSLSLDPPLPFQLSGTVLLWLERTFTKAQN